MQPSKIFILSLTYPIGLNAIIFRPISTINIQVKASLKVESKSIVSYSVKDPSNAKTTVLATTARVKKFSINFPFIKKPNSLCLTAIKPIIPAI